MQRIDRARRIPTLLTGGQCETIAALFKERGELRTTRRARTDEPAHNRYKRMEAAWRALAVEQDWLDGEIVRSTDGRAEPP